MDLRKAVLDIKNEKDVEVFRKDVANEIERLKEQVGLLKVEIRESSKGLKNEKNKMIKKSETK